MVITYFAAGDLSLSTVTDDLNELNDHIQKLIDLGVAGINLEDAQGEDIYLKKLTSIKNYLRQINQPLFINARTMDSCKNWNLRWKEH